MPRRPSPLKSNQADVNQKQSRKARRHLFMRNRMSIVTLLAVALGTTAASALAQMPASQPSAGGLPARSPFDVPYGMPITLEDATHALQAAQAEAGRHGWPE